MLKYFASVTLILVLFAQLSSGALAQTGSGTVTIQIQGYGTIHGQLQNAAIDGNNNVAMSMAVSDQMQTSQGTFPIVATGNWVGALNNSSLTGNINDIKGKVTICTMFCGDVDFVGQGNWSGQIDTSQNGSGFETGTITVTSSPYPQIPPGQTMPFSGSWSVSFPSTGQTSTSTPEFHSSIILLASLIAASMILASRKLCRE